MNSYGVGQKVTLTATFTDANGNLVDPVDVSFTYRSSDGTETTALLSLAQVTRASAGLYQTVAIPDKTGWWEYQAKTIDPSFQATTDLARFYVRVTVFDV